MKTLEGIRILDLTQAYSGPFCTMHLADHGAEVIKIEPPEYGDWVRTWPPVVNGRSAYFAFLNRNKKSLTLDLKSQEGKEIFKNLVKTADVICENFRPGVMDKLGFGYEELKGVNPNIIYASLSGFGLDGPFSQRPSYALVAEAISGMMSLTGYPDGPPTKTGVSIGDNLPGTYLALGICMALFHREKFGVGQQLDVAMVDTLFSALESAVVTYSVTGRITPRIGNKDMSAVPYDSFPAKDGDIVMAAASPKNFEDLCNLLGKPEIVNDPRFAEYGDRFDNYDDHLKPIIEEFTIQYTRNELDEMFANSGIPCAKILNVAEAMEHPQILAREMLVDIYDPGFQRNIKIHGVPIKMHETPGSVDTPAPLLGEHNHELLSQLGLTEGKI